jgi:hypothetical protein
MEPVSVVNADLSYIVSYTYVRWQKWNNLDIYGCGAKIIVSKEEHTVLLSL